MMCNTPTGPELQKQMQMQLAQVVLHLLNGTYLQRVHGVLIPLISFVLIKPID